MIYKDKKAPFDTADIPASRGELCITCRKTWLSHEGWHCFTTGTLYTFSQLQPHERYLTQSMLDSIVGEEEEPSTQRSLVAATMVTPITAKKKAVTSCTQKPTPTDISDWRTWSHKVPGECACGIVKSKCDYHR